MGRVVRFVAPGDVAVVSYDDPPLSSSSVRIETLYSGISAGTELTAYRGTNPYVHKRWDAWRRVFEPGRISFDFPIDGWGYEEVGRVVEVGPNAREVEVGDVIFGTWGHRSTHIVPWHWAARRRLPPTLDPVAGVFSHIGAIAMNAVLDADIHVGEVVAVFGQGVPGQIVSQLARLNGGTVIAVDAVPGRLALSERLGAQHTVDVTEQSPAQYVKDLTGGRGADVSIEISGSYLALNEAIRTTAYNSRVIVSGFFQGEANGLSLGEEFHHNRVCLICSQISGVGPHLEGRWDVDRLQRTVIDLAAAGRLDLPSLVSHRVPFEEAAEAFRLLDRHPEETVQVVLEFAAQAMR
jgi:2-desacetyl-2-hydroxyethyl bacteriochlorophyllide A dehydrogenase